MGGGIAAPILWTYVLKDYQKRRILVFLNPEANLLGSGWHAHHARIAIGAGGWTGRAGQELKGRKGMMDLSGRGDKDVAQMMDVLGI